ncbi:MAG: hypothetical protein WAP23_02055 [Candidatus Spechtbacterales bacterium]
MAILTTQRKKQKNLIVVMILIVAVSFGVLYLGVFGRESEEPTVGKSGVSLLRGIKEVKLNLDLLRDKRFLDLEPYRKLPTDIKTGRDNPFVPYGAQQVP